MTLGTKMVTLKALVAGEEREALVDYSSDGFYFDDSEHDRTVRMLVHGNCRETGRAATAVRAAW